MLQLQLNIRTPCICICAGLRWCVYIYICHRQVKTGKPAYRFYAFLLISGCECTNSSCKCTYSAYFTHSLCVCVHILQMRIYIIYPMRALVPAHIMVANVHILHICHIQHMRIYCKCAFPAYVAYSAHVHVLQMGIYCIYRMQIRICNIYRISAYARMLQTRIYCIYRIFCTCTHVANAHLLPMLHTLHMCTYCKCAFTTYITYSAHAHMLGMRTYCICRRFCTCVHAANMHLLYMLSVNVHFLHMSHILDMRTCCQCVLTACIAYSAHAHMLQVHIYCIYSIYCSCCSCCKCALTAFICIYSIYCSCCTYCVYWSTCI